jgi:effector-binding domain-containing protein
MLDTPHISFSAAQPLAVIRLTATREQLHDAVSLAIGELLATLAVQDVEPAGPLFKRHLRWNSSRFEVAVGVPVAAPVAPAGRVRAAQMAAVRVARAVYHGDYEGLPGAWKEFDGWVGQTGLATGPDWWESYAVGPELSDDAADWRTELYRPLAVA